MKVALGSSPPLMLMAFRFLAAGLPAPYFFRNPVLGLALGTLFLGEPLRPADLAGSALVAAGIYGVQRP